MERVLGGGIGVVGDGGGGGNFGTGVKKAWVVAVDLTIKFIGVGSGMVEAGNGVRVGEGMVLVDYLSLENVLLFAFGLPL